MSLNVLGEEYGIGHIGTFAVNVLRMEKGMILNILDLNIRTD